LTGPTAVLHQGRQQTALLPPGALTGPRTPPPYTDYQQGPDQPSRRRGRIVGWALTGLLLLGALALGAWGLTRALEGATDPPPPTAEPVPPAEPTSTPPREPTDDAETPPPQPTPPTGESTEPPAETVTVNPLDYIGDPADEAAEALRDDGLRVRIQRQDGDAPDDRSSCRVTSVDPSGAVPEGSTVTLTCFEPGE
jgi:eukaryotic-like serine/threonine-protein kinase